MWRTFSTAGGFGTSLLALLVLVSCSTGRTKYGPYKKNYGYQDLPPEDDLKVVSFKANPYTRPVDALLFAKFRATEVCAASGKGLTHIIDVKDRSRKKNVIRSSSTGFPSSYYYGMSPFYNRYSSVGFGISTATTEAHEETYVYPDITVTFDCVEVALGPEILVREVSADEMKLLVKDLQGALQVEKILSGSPNAGVLEVGDVILRVEGERVQTALALFRRFRPEHRNVPVEILREGIRKKITLKSADVSTLVRESQEGIIQSACGKKENKELPLCVRK